MADVLLGHNFEALIATFLLLVDIHIIELSYIKQTPSSSL